MKKYKLDILDISASQLQNGSFTLVLEEKENDIRIPIVIGMFEAQAIALELEKIKSTRPLTHDLFASLAKAFDYTIEEILITDISDGVFYAKIVCSDGIRQKNIDARPSDAIAIALRFNAPIYAVKKVIDEAGVSTADLMGNVEDEFESATSKSIDISDLPSTSESLRDMTLSELQSKLTEALNLENYEEAAKIRDEIERRN